MKPDQLLGVLKAKRGMAVLRTSDTAAARHAMAAAITGGMRVVEFTLSIPSALDLIREFRRTHPDVVVGAGTVLTAEDAKEAVDAGAQFLVAPTFHEPMVKTAAALGVAAIPGCATPTEMWQAYRAGAPLQKLFPEAGTGPTWVQQTLGPMPFLKIVPTAGVTLQNAPAYLAAGAFAIGFVNSLFDPDDIRHGHFEKIRERAEWMCKALEKP